MRLLRGARAFRRIQESTDALASYERDGDLGALRRAVSTARWAAGATAAGTPLRPLAASVLSRALRHRFDRYGADEDLREAVDLAQEAVAVAAPDDENRAYFHTEVGILRLQAFERFQDPDDLARAMVAHEAGVAASEPGSAEYCVRLGNLANAHRVTYDRFGGLDHLEKAVEIGTWAAAIMPLPTTLTILAASLHQRFDVTGRPADLDEALAQGRRAVEVTPAGDPTLPGRLSNLALAHVKVHLHTGAASDLDEAIALVTRAVEATPPDHSAFARYSTNLGIALRRRGQRTGSIRDLRAAAAAGLRAVEATAAGQPDVLLWRNNLLNTRMALYWRTRDAADLAEAIALGEGTLAQSPSDHRQLARWKSNLGITYLVRHEHTGTIADLDRAVELGEQAVTAVSVDQPDRVMFTAQLYWAYQARLAATGQGVAPDELRRVVEWLDSATSSSAFHRVQVGHVVGGVAHAMGEHGWAVRALDSALRALPTVAPRTLARLDQEHALGAHLGLVGEAVAAHLAVGDSARAVEAAEAGRGVLLSVALDLRSDLADLADVDPELAHRLRWARDRVAEADGVAADDLTRRWRDYEELVASVRALPGFSRFLLPPILDELRPPGEGIAVVVNVSHVRGDAVLVSGTGAPVPIPLPDLRHDEALTWARRLREATADTGSWAASLRARRVVGDVLAWLWDVVAGPVVDLLPREGLARVWWLPTGPLGLFPLHAAGPREGGGVLDHAVSSYTPTLRALVHAARRPPAPARRQLTVTLAATPGLPPLPATAAEAVALADQAPDGVVLSDEDATTTDVLAALGGATWAHFACHAGIDPAAPSLGGLHLHDGRLAIGRIDRLRLDHAELAYLSACSTARTGWWHADEAVHLASAFHLVGYRHVVGSLWPLADSVASKAATAFYGELPPDPKSGDFAPALHRVVRALRDDHPDRPDLWASFIHSGP